MPGPTPTDLDKALADLPASVREDYEEFAKVALDSGMTAEDVAEIVADMESEAADYRKALMEGLADAGFGADYRDAEKREFSGREREKMAERGKAMNDGSFPIEDEADLKNAIRAIGRAKDGDKAKAHIIRRAKALGLTDMLPSGWVSKNYGENCDDKGKKKRRRMMGDERMVKFSVEFAKTDDDARLVYGWASMVQTDGNLVVDKQGDVITPETLVEAAHAFMTDARKGKLMHKGHVIAEVVESVIMTADVQKKMGVDLGGDVGWFIGMKVHDDEVWKGIKDGTYRAFSIGGRGVRVPLKD